MKKQLPTIASTSLSHKLCSKHGQFVTSASPRMCGSWIFLTHRSSDRGASQEGPKLLIIEAHLRDITTRHTCLMIEAWHFYRFACWNPPSWPCWLNPQTCFPLQLITISGALNLFRANTIELWCAWSPRSNPTNGKAIISYRITHCHPCRRCTSRIWCNVPTSRKTGRPGSVSWEFDQRNGT